MGSAEWIPVASKASLIPPLGEAGTEVPVLDQALVQTIETFADLFSRQQGHVFRALIDFDARDYPDIGSALAKGIPAAVDCPTAERQ